MHFRELPGFGHTRLLLSTVADELEAWQLQVDESVSQAFNAYTSTANALAMKMTAQVNQLPVVCCIVYCPLLIVIELFIMCVHVIQYNE